MRAFVLSGGGNRGPLEVGAVRVLLESGITPELIVGSSAGALNGAFLAVEPTACQAAHLADIWRTAGRDGMIAGGLWRVVWNLLRRKPSFYGNAALARFVEASLPARVRTFGDLSLPFYATIAHWRTRTLYVYGDDPAGSLVQALVTSAAVPGFFPPAWHLGEAFVDGGVVSNVPVQVAAARGATELWVLDLAYTTDVPRRMDGGLSCIRHAVYPALYSEALAELESVAGRPGITLHHIPLPGFQDVGLGDFTANEAMLESGAAAAQAYLERPEPGAVRRPRRFAEFELPPGPPGSRPFVWAPSAHHE